MHHFNLAFPQISAIDNKPACTACNNVLFQGVIKQGFASWTPVVTPFLNHPLRDLISPKYQSVCLLRVYVLVKQSAQWATEARGERQVNRWLQGISCHWPMAGPHFSHYTVARAKNTNRTQHTIAARNTHTLWPPNWPTQPWTHSTTLRKGLTDQTLQFAPHFDVKIRLIKLPKKYQTTQHI